VARNACPTDGRAFHIVLTPRGRHLLKRSAPGHIRAVATHFADPLSPQELKSAGVFWLESDDTPPIAPGIGMSPTPGAPPAAVRRPVAPVNAQPVMLTRLHVRYSPQTFPEDLMFQETKDRQNFQTRYVIRQPWKGDANACEEAKAYVAQLPARFEREAQTLASLTGWDIADIRKNIDYTPVPPVAVPQKPWWQNLWKQPAQ